MSTTLSIAPTMAAAAQFRFWQEARNQAIHDMRQAGASLQQIANAAGLSKSGVAKILNRSETS